MRAPRCTVPAPVEAAARRDDHPAAADAEVERLVEALAAVLEQHVLAGDAEVGRAVAARTSARRTARSDHERRRPAGSVPMISLRDVSGSSAGTMPAAREQRQRFVEDAPLRQRDGERDMRRSGRRTVDSTAAQQAPNRASRSVRSSVSSRDALTAYDARRRGRRGGRHRWCDTGLMSMPPRRVKRAYDGERLGAAARPTSTKMRSTQCSWKPGWRRNEHEVARAAPRDRCARRDRRSARSRSRAAR